MRYITEFCVFTGCREEHVCWITEFKASPENYLEDLTSLGVCGAWKDGVQYFSAHTQSWQDEL